MVRNLKRIISIILLLSTVMLFNLTACSGEKVSLDPDHPVTLVVWHYYNGPQKVAFDDAVREFNETEGYERGIIVEAISKNSVSQLADDIIASAKNDLGASELPDIFGCYGDSAYELLKMDKLVQLDTYINKKTIEEYVDSFIQEGKLSTDHLYIFPTAKSTESIFLNKTDFDLFASAVSGAPYNQKVTYDDLKTWEGVKRVGVLYSQYTDDLTPETAGDGKGFFGLDSIANFLTVGGMQLGYDIAPVKEGKLSSYKFDADKMRRMFDLYYGGIIEGAFIKIGSYASDDIKTGDSIAMLASTTGASYFPKEITRSDGTQYPIDLLVLPMPVFENGTAYAVSQGAGMAVVKSNPEQEYASSLFLLWFTSEERNIKFSIESGYIPVKKEALNSGTINEMLGELGSNDSFKGTVAALETGINQINTYKLCYSNIFDGSIAHRNILQNSLIEFSKEARAGITADLKNGKSMEELKKEAYSDDIFNSWLANLEKSIEDAVK